MEDQIIYPNAPLKEVDFEIRFDGDIEIFSKMNLMQKAFKKSFPQLFVPIVNGAGQPYDLEPYNFRSANDQKGILVSINRFGFYTREYSGFSNYREELKNNLDVFFSIIDTIEKFNRIGLRYNNFIPYNTNKDTIPLYDKLKIQFENKTFPSEIIDANLNYCFKLNDAYLSMMIKPNQIYNQNLLELDFDYWSTGQVENNQIYSFIDHGHEFIRNVFLNLVTDDFKIYMKGLS